MKTQIVAFGGAGHRAHLRLMRMPSGDDKRVPVVAAITLDSESEAKIRAHVNPCSRREFSFACGDNFSPHLGESLSIGVTMPGCAHTDETSIGDETKKVFLEIEAMRETMFGKDHIAWVDMDETAAGLQQQIEAAGRSGFSVAWDGIAQVNLTELIHRDVFRTPMDSFYRAMPSVVAGEPVPPPFCSLIARLRNKDQEILETIEKIACIPQVVNIIAASDEVVALFSSAVLVRNSSNEIVTLAAGCSMEEARQVLSGMAEAAAEFYPSDINIVFVYDANVQGRHKTISLSMVSDDDNYLIRGEAGLNPANSNPSGDGHLYVAAIKRDLISAYSTMSDRNDIFSLPLSKNDQMKDMAFGSAHETGHMLGLVDPAYFETEDEEIKGHNKIKDKNNPGTKIMDPGGLWRVQDRLRNHGESDWMPLNYEYLRFILPKSKEP